MKEREIQRQADAFRGYYRKTGGDLEQVFTIWCDSKEFRQVDRDRIWLALHGMDRRVA